jgi:2-keto-4-pentenoate hydratase/2-oxohepta-3-ene-1,7-dioic acid hydratase in catechol pathway
MSFKLLSYGDGGTSTRAGLLVCDEVYDVARLLDCPGYAQVSSILANWRVVGEQLGLAAEAPPEHCYVGSVSSVKLAAPLEPVGAIFCAAANFKDHMLAMAQKLGQPPEPDPRELDVKPYHFLKPTRQTMVGPDAVVQLPVYAQRIDWEAELVAVIGTVARNVPVARALDHVAGYTVGNDLSVRDRAFMKRPNVPEASLFKTDFIGMKGFDQSCPIGPWIVPAAAIGEPQRLAIKLWLDDELMQDSSTANMVFSVAEQIAYLSERVTLLPGDIIMTGTPAGTGAEQDRFLRAGQTLRAWVEHIGELRTFLA